MIPGRYRLEDFHRMLIDLVHLLDHDDRIGPRRQCVPGIHVFEDGGSGRLGASQFQLLSGEFRGAEGILRAHTNSVHGRRMIMRRRNLCEDGPRGDPIERLVDGNFLADKPRRIHG